MNCLVTGGMGFIGSALAHRLAELGHEVKVFDLPSAGNDLHNLNIRVLHRDITQPALHDFRCDWCFHLAALADIVASVERPWPYHRVNVDGTVNVLDHCVRLGVKKLIYASSTSIYGIPKEYPTRESAPADPQYPYALTKWVAEQYVMHWGKVYKLPVVALRPTTVYGPGMKSRGYGSAFNVFMPQKANGAAFTVVGDGAQMRDFVYITDVVEAFVRAAESDIWGEVFNVGSGEPRSVNTLVELLGAREVVYVPKRPSEPIMTFADIGKIKAMLAWRPSIRLELGTAVMLEHLHEWKGQRVWTPQAIEEATREWFRCLT